MAPSRRTPPAGPNLTERQKAYVREHEAFEASGVLRAWEEKRATLDAERLALHGQALVLDADAEAGDLLRSHRMARQRRL